MAVSDNIRKAFCKVADAFYEKRMGFFIAAGEIGEAAMRSGDFLVPTGVGVAIISSPGKKRDSACDQYCMLKYDKGGRQLVNRIASYGDGWIPLARIATLPFARRPGMMNRVNGGLDDIRVHVYCVPDRQTRIAAGKALVDMQLHPEKYGNRAGPERFSLEFDKAFARYSHLRGLGEIAKRKNGFLAPVRHEARKVAAQQKQAMRN